MLLKTNLLLLSFWPIFFLDICDEIQQNDVLIKNKIILFYNQRVVRLDFLFLFTEQYVEKAVISCASSWLPCIIYIYTFIIGLKLTGVAILKLPLKSYIHRILCMQS